MVIKIISSNYLKPLFWETKQIINRNISIKTTKTISVGNKFIKNTNKSIKETKAISKEEEAMILKDILEETTNIIYERKEPIKRKINNPVIKGKGIDPIIKVNDPIIVKESITIKEEIFVGNEPTDQLVGLDKLFGRVKDIDFTNLSKSITALDLDEVVSFIDKMLDEVKSISIKGYVNEFGSIQGQEFVLGNGTSQPYLNKYINELITREAKLLLREKIEPVIVKGKAKKEPEEKASDKLSHIEEKEFGK